MFNWIKRILCNHNYAELTRWRWFHPEDSESIKDSVLIEFKCKKCGKFFLLRLDCKKSQEWAEIMGDYKKQ